jgi:hypothetical protein
MWDDCMCLPLWDLVGSVQVQVSVVLMVVVAEFLPTVKSGGGGGGAGGGAGGGSTGSVDGWCGRVSIHSAPKCEAQHLAHISVFLVRAPRRTSTNKSSSTGIGRCSSVSLGFVMASRQICGCYSVV